MINHIDLEKFFKETFPGRDIVRSSSPISTMNELIDELRKKDINSIPELREALDKNMAEYERIYTHEHSLLHDNHSCVGLVRLCTGIRKHDQQISHNDRGIL